MTPLGPSSRTEISSRTASDGLIGPKLTALAQTNSSDQIAKLLTMSGMDTVKLLEILDALPSAEAAAQASVHFGFAVSALSAGDVPDGLSHLAALAALDPRRAETLAADPALSFARAEVSQFVAKLTLTAKAEAETRIEQARQLPPAAELPLASNRTWTSDMALAAAERLMETGGYANYVRSTELSQLVLDRGAWLPVPSPASPLPPLGTIPRLIRWPDGSAAPVRPLLWLAIVFSAFLILAWGLLSHSSK